MRQKILTNVLQEKILLKSGKAAPAFLFGTYKVEKLPEAHINIREFMEMNMRPENV